MPPVRRITLTTRAGGQSTDTVWVCRRAGTAAARADSTTSTSRRCAA